MGHDGAPRNIIAVYVPSQFSQVVRLYSYYYPESNIPKDISLSLSEFSRNRFYFHLNYVHE